MSYRSGSFRGRRKRRRSLASLIVRRFLASLPCVSPPIGEALALNALGGQHSAFHVGQVVGVVTEVELAEIAFQMLCAEPLVIAGDASLEDTEIALNGVGVSERSTDIFLDLIR